jgi:ankyrin repeat protein
MIMKPARLSCLIVLWLLLGFSLLSGCGGPGEKEEKKAAPPALNEALREAAARGSLQGVRSALDQGADVDDADANGTTALLLAAFDGHTPIVRLLLDRGADVRARNVQGRTALMCAASGGFDATVRLLLERGSEVNVQGRAEGFTALMFAANEGHIEVVRTLLQHGANPRLLDVDRDMAVDFARRKGYREIERLLREAAGKQ